MGNLSTKQQIIDKVSSPAQQVGANSADLQIFKINIDEVEVLAGRRIVDPNWIEVLAEDISKNGQLTPIEVVKQKNGYRLISGAHRLAAIKHNFTQEILAIVKNPNEFANEAEIKLREIAENFMRRELSVLDRAMDVAAWREIFEAAQGAIKRGGDKGLKRAKKPKFQVGTLVSNEGLENQSAKFALRFSDAAQQALKLGRGSVFRALTISTIAPDVREYIALHAIANNQSELLALAVQPKEKQGQIAQLILDEKAKNVSCAVAIIDKLPASQPIEPWQKLNNSFASLKPTEKTRFFELNRAAIELWIAQG